MRHGVFFLLFYRHVFHPLLKCSPPLSPPLSAAKASLKKDTTHKCVISIIYVYGHFSSLLHIIKHIKTGLLLHQKNIIWALSSLSLSLDLFLSVCLPPPSPSPCCHHSHPPYLLPSLAHFATSQVCRSVQSCCGCSAVERPYDSFPLKEGQKNRERKREHKVSS